MNGQWLQHVGAKLMITTRIQEEEIKAKLTFPTSTLILESFTVKEGKLFLERKLDKVTESNEKNRLDEAEEISRELGGLPLALDQAAAFMKSTQCSFSLYLPKIQKEKLKILNKRKAIPATEEVEENRLAVATTWNVHMDWMKENNFSAYHAMLVLAHCPPVGVHRCILNEGLPKVDNRCSNSFTIVGID